MDRTAWIAVIVCIALIFGWQHYVDRTYPTKHVVRPAATAPASPTDPTVAPAQTPTLPISQLKSAPNPVATVSTAELPKLRQATLKNKHIEVSFRNHGGAIDHVTLLDHKIDDARLVQLNAEQPEPILNLVGWEDTQLLVGYEMAATDDEVTFTRTLPGGLTFIRQYRLVGPYQIALEQTVTNPTALPVTLPAYRLNVGTAGPLHKHDTPNFTTASWFTDTQQHYHREDVLAFDVGGIMGMNWREARSVVASELTPLRWVAVKNQFFTAILTPQDSLRSSHAIAERVNLPKFVENGPVPHAIKASAYFAPLTVPAQGSIATKFNLYTGPKEYDQIKVLGSTQQEVMEFGWFGWVIKPLLWSMNILHRGIPQWTWPAPWEWNLNYGWAVVFITLIIKGIFWPLQSAANRSMKQMQALAPRMKELQEKYKEEPQKMQAELMKLYKDYGVNPMGGCLPMLVQIPIFMGFYTMLQSAIELRHVSWFWVHDLSLPDTIYVIPGLGLDVNPLPLLMTVSQWYLMKMTPTPQDNPSMKIMQWMPFIFLFMLYNFAAALSLYWTINNVVSIVQTYRNLKKPLPTLERSKKPKRANPFAKKKL